MRAAGLERTDDLVDVETEVTPHVTDIVLLVMPVKLAHDELGIELERAFTHKPLGNKAAERALGDEEANFIVSIHPISIGSVLNTIVSNGADEGLDKDREAAGINRVEAEGLLVDSQLDATIRIINEGILLDFILSRFVVTSHQSKEVGFNTGFIAEDFDLSGRGDEHEVLTSTVTEELRREAVTHIVRECDEELMTHGGGGNTAKEVNGHLIVTTSKDLTEGGRTILEDRFDTREGQELRANVGSIKGLNGVLKVLLGNAIRVDDRVTGLIQADGRTLTTEGFELGRKHGLTELGLGAYGAASINRGIKAGVREALVSHHTIGNERPNLFAHVIRRSATIYKVGIRVIQGDISDGLVPKNGDLRSNTRRIIVRGKRAG